MKVKKHVVRKFKNVQSLTPVFVVCLLIAAGGIIYNFAAHAASGGFTFDSTTSSYNVGDTISLPVYEDSGTDCTNVVQIDLSYPSALLRYASFSANGSKFESTATSKQGSGTLSLVQYTTRKECGSGATATSGVSGKQLVGIVSFTAVSAGNATVTFANSSIAISAEDNKTDVAPGKTSTNLTIASSGSTQTGSGGGSTSPSGGSGGNKAPTQSTSGGSSTPSLSVTKTGTDSSVSVGDNESVELTEPVDVNPLPIQPDGVDRVEYYLNGKLMATTKTEPYTYHIDTKNILNGTYTLTTKTYYENGQTKSASQKLVVNNPFSLTQVKLWIQKFAWLIIIILLVVGAAVAAWIIHRRGGGTTNYYGDKNLENTNDYMVAGSNFVTTDTQKPFTPEENGPQVHRPTHPSPQHF